MENTCCPSPSSLRYIEADSGSPKTLRITKQGELGLGLKNTLSVQNCLTSSKTQPDDISKKVRVALLHCKIDLKRRKNVFIRKSQREVHNLASQMRQMKEDFQIFYALLNLISFQRDSKRSTQKRCFLAFHSHFTKIGSISLFLKTSILLPSELSAVRLHTHLVEKRNNTHHDRELPYTTFQAPILLDLTP